LHIFITATELEQDILSFIYAGMKFAALLCEFDLQVEVLVC
jgi:hypothetical protein